MIKSLLFFTALGGIILLCTQCFRAPWLYAAGNYFNLTCLCNSVTGTAGLTAQVYRAVFHPHPFPGRKYDTPFAIFSLPISDSFPVSFYIQKGIIPVQERSGPLLQLHAARTEAVSRYLSFTQCYAHLGDQSIWLIAECFPAVFSSPVPHLFLLALGVGRLHLEGEQSSWIGICHVATKIAKQHYDFNHKIII